MTPLQKTIKSLSIAFAIFLAVIIISGIASGIMSLLISFSGSHKVNERIEAVNIEITENVSGLDIQSDIGRLIVREGTKWGVSGQYLSKNFKSEVVDGILHIENLEKNNIRFRVFSGKGKANLIIEVPKGTDLEKVYVNSSVGNLEISDLVSDKFILEGAVGNGKVHHVASNEVIIEAGVGNLNLTDVSFKNVTVKGGVGNLNLSGSIQGDSKVSSGVGNITLKLDDEREDYNLSAESGIGFIKINGKKAGDTKEDRKEAENSLDIESGIGNIYIDFR
jgi:hypothetical protein